IYAGAITDDQADDIKNHFYDLPTTMKGRNCHIVPLGGVRVIILSDLHKQTGLHVSYTLASRPPTSAPLATDDVLQLLSSFLQDVLTFATFKKGTSSARSRFTLLHNPASRNSNPEWYIHVSSLFSHLVSKDLLSKATASQMLQALGPRGDSCSLTTAYRQRKALASKRTCTSPFSTLWTERRGPGGDGEAIDEHEFILAGTSAPCVVIRRTYDIAVGSSFAGSSHSEQPHSGEAPHHFGP
ncbi:hypothetical protein H4582DRAFT_2065798, partial [Lactarius indigo]